MPDTRKKKIPIIELTVVLLIAVLVVIIMMAGKKTETGQNNSEISSSEPQNVEKWQEGVIEHNGKYYKYNNRIHTYLIMGIDKEETETVIDGAALGGQSDAMFLLVADSSKEKMSVISINRNSMTDIEVYDESGAKVSTLYAQICTQHGFGDGKHLSCSRATDAVSRLFYKIPIKGYLSMRMGAIPVMNDAIGGVELTVLQDLEYPGKGVSLKEGETKKLSGDEAYAYLRGRALNEFDSASDRLRRQEQYITAFTEQVKAYTAGSTSKLLAIYDSIEDYIVTNVDFANLASQLSSYKFEKENMYTVPGETIMGSEFEEYHVDDDALYDMIIEVFYEEVE